MRIATEVKGYITVPSPKDIIYAPIDLAVSISNGLVERGHQVDFYGPEGSHLKKANLVTMGLRPLAHTYDEYQAILFNPSLQSDNVLALWDQYLAEQMFRKAHAGEYDLLHFHHPEVALPFTKVYPDVPVVYTLHDPVEALQYEILEMFASPSQHYISISDKQRETAPNLNYAGTIYNGIDTNYFAFNSGKRDDYLLFLGSILPRKGAKEAVEVAIKTNSRLLLVGPTYPEEQGYFNTYIAPFLNDKIQYIGHVPHNKIASYFQHAKAFLMPIQWEEPFGLTMSEAMSCGTPVIAFDRGSVSEILIHGKTGFITHTVDEMAEAVQHIENINPAVCRAHVVEKFSVATMINGYEETFDRILKAPK